MMKTVNGKINIGIILSGGTGNRFGGNTPKQYLSLNGREVISYSVGALKASGCVDKIIAAASAEYRARLSEDYGIATVENGETRNKSLKNALDYIRENYPDCKKTIILEAARPMITAETVRQYLDLTNKYDSVITGQRIVDSLGSFRSHTADRSDYYLIQAPEAFDFPKLYRAFDENSPLTATNHQMPEDSSLFVNFDFRENFKITYAEDLAYCELFLRKRNEI